MFMSIWSYKKEWPANLKLGIWAPRQGEKKKKKKADPYPCE